MRKLFIILPVALFVIASFWTSCKKDDLVTLQGGNCDTCDMSVCDTAFKISYKNDIVPILEAKCYNCHNYISAPGDADGNVLDGPEDNDYNYLLPYVQDSTLMRSIRHVPGFEPMPKDDDKLSNCKILRFDRWVKNGAPNN